jgi:exocyst complex component 2
VKADQVFLPILENASKAQKVRSTLGVFERSKFFFNLPGSLQESFEAVTISALFFPIPRLIGMSCDHKGRYEVAMRDYKKGRVLLDSKPGDILPARAGSTSSINSQTSLSAEQQQKRVFDKVWGAVEKVMGDMRNTLISQLKEPSRTVEEQEKTIE